MGMAALSLATAAPAAVAGIAVAGLGIGAGAPARLGPARPDRARTLGQTLTVAAAGQFVGPLTAGVPFKWDVDEEARRVQAEVRSSNALGKARVAPR